MSYTGLLRPTISISQPLHEPASTSRMCSERPKTLLIFFCNWRPIDSTDCPPGPVEDLKGLLSPALSSRGGEGEGPCSSCSADFVKKASCVPSGRSRYLAIVLKSPLCLAANSQLFVMRIAVSTSAHNPQKMQAPRSSVAVRVPSPSAQLMAPVGQIVAAGRASFHCAKSISGRPRALLEMAAGASG